MSHGGTHAECRLVQSLEIFVLSFDSALHGVLPGRRYCKEVTGELDCGRGLLFSFCLPLSAPSASRCSALPKACLSSGSLRVVGLGLPTSSLSSKTLYLYEFNRFIFKSVIQIFIISTSFFK